MSGGLVCAGLVGLLLLGLAAEAGAQAPGAFGKLTPANGATGRPTRPTATWEAASGATSYTVCADLTDNDLCDSLWENVGNVTSITWTGPELEHSTTYYWQVRAVNASGFTGADSRTWWHFTTVEDAPAAFGKTAPANGEAGQSTSPTLTWGTSTRATSYEYCYDTTDDGACGGTWTSTGTNTSVALSGLTGGATHYWHVRARNAGGTTYADANTWWSFTTKPGAFGKLTPTNGATGRSLSPTATWQASTGATSYEVCGDTTNNSTCDAAWVSVGNVTSVTWPGPALVYDTVYYWQVRAVNAGEYTPADSTTWWNFRTQAEAPGTFNKSLPANAAVGVSTSPTLTWGASARATSYEYCYDTTNDAGCTGSWTSAGTATSVPLSGLAYDTVYYWQVRALNAGGTTYANSATWWSFTTQIAPPGVFTKATPPNGGTVPTRNHALTWNASAGAEYYEFCVDTTNDGACSGQWTQTLNGTTSANVTEMANGTTSYWQVRAVNSSGTTVADGGAWWSYTVQELPAAFAKTGPDNGATAQPTSLTLSWNGSLLATSYEYCYDTTSDSACSGSWTNVGNLTSVAVSGLAHGTTYYWQVEAKNAFGSTLANSNAWWSFTTVVDKPAGFGKITPTNGATGRSLTPTATWQASTGATSYEVCGDTVNNSACDTAWVNVGNVTSVTWPGPALDAGTTYYWQVRAMNAGGFTAADDQVWWHFTTQIEAPGTFDKTAPANGALALMAGLTLRWNTSARAASYEYCVDTTDDGACSTTWTNVGASTHAVLGGLSYDTVYYWQVRAVNTTGTRDADAGTWWEWRSPRGSVAVSAGMNYNCELKGDGTVACWGQNTDGEATPPAGTFTQLTLGWSHTCGLRTDNTVACWGDTADGKATPPDGTFTQVSAGSAHTCGLRTDGTVACWGRNTDAFGDWAGQATPPAGTFTQVSSGAYHACGVRTDGTVACWGWNNDGQATPPGGYFTRVSAGGYHTCALQLDGTVVCWGWARGGVTPPEGTFTELSAGGYHTCAMRPNRTVVCWGYNEYGQTTPPAGTFTQVGSGWSHTCGVRTDGSVACWGYNEYGMATPPTGTFTQVSAGYDHACGVRSDRTMACWGETSYGGATPPAGTFTQLSAGGVHTCGLRPDATVACWGWTGDSDFYIPAALSPVGTYRQVSAGALHTCAVRTDLKVECWGCNTDRSGNAMYQSLAPEGTFLQVSAGFYHTCGVQTDGTVACWGSNDHGQATPPAGSFAQVSSGFWHTCGVRTDGTAACWGSDSLGMATPPSGTFTQVSVGTGHTCGVRTNGSVACWGSDSRGQATPPAGTFTQVSAGSAYTCGLRTDGAVVCWGYNGLPVAAVVRIEPMGLRDAAAGHPYAATFMASLGTAEPYKFSVVEGTLPPGLTLDGATGALTGTPEQAGTWAFTVRATDANDVAGERAYQMTAAAGEDPTPFGKLLPANGATGRSTYPMVKWEASSGATSYVVCGDTVDNDTCDTAWVNVGNVTSVTWPGPALAYGTVYYWQVRAQNASGQMAADSRTWWSFQTQMQPSLKSDILWRGTGGDLWLWGIQGATHATDAYVGIVADPNWEIRGQGDLDGDGTADLLWRHKLDGTIYYWRMSGGAPAAQLYVSTVGVSYDIAGTGDFDGDGKADILWRNPALGDLWLWRMNGAAVLSQTYVDTVDLSYSIKGLGDLNGDTKTDLVWAGTAGDIWVWLMNGAAKTAQTFVKTVADPTYQLQQVADVDGDLKADLLWWNTAAGDVWIWQMNGAAISSESYVGMVADTHYRIMAAGDYNGDGKADILWRNIVAGDVWVWLMNGPVKDSEAYVGIVPDLGYQIVK